MGNVVIQVDPPIKGHKGQISRIEVRPPSFDEYQEHGDAIIWVPIDKGRAFPSENPAVIKEYSKILVVDVDPLLLRQGGYKLAEAIKEAILSFFLPAAAAPEA